MTGDVNEEILRSAQEIRDRGASAPRPARDAVNLPAIRTWQEALDDDDPRWVAEGLAPPAMIQVWTMPGLRGVRPADDPLALMTTVLDEAGFTSVVATNCRQTYHRELRVGEELTVTARLGDVVGPKRTALGEGWFMTTVSTWACGDEPVAEMTFRLLKFRPPSASVPAPTTDAEPAPAASSDALPATDGPVTRPVVSRDTAFFWEGATLREFRIQSCEDCGALRHPPGPVCTACGSARRSHVVASGLGTVHSFVVHHHPPTPGRVPPYVVVLVDLEEGVRVVGELLGADPGDVVVGMPVELGWQDGGDALVLPAWRPRARMEEVA